MPGNADYAELLAEFTSHRFSTLRPAQAAVLTRYAAEHSDSSDVAIELPTGAGKSLVALLICEAWRREGRKAAILTGNKTLARQMEQEAADLGVNIVRMEGAGTDIPSTSKRSYHRALKELKTLHTNFMVLKTYEALTPSDAPSVVVNGKELLKQSQDLAMAGLHSGIIDLVDHKKPALEKPRIPAPQEEGPVYA